MKIELWDLSRIRPYHQNPRDNDQAVDAVAASLREFGWRQPIVTDSEGVVVVGDTRLKAARKLGLKQAPVHVAIDLSPAQIRAYRIADNQTGNISDWNLELLSLELNDLDGMNFDLTLLGFEPDELAQWMGEEAKDGLTDPDLVPPPPDEVVTRPGDLWILGEHRLLCGDSTKAADVQKVLGVQIPFLMVTDPPYGVDYDPAWRHEAGVNKSNRKGKVKNDNIADWTPAWRLFPGNVAYVWHGGLHSATVQQSLLGSGFVVRAQIVWVKPRMVLSRGHYHWKHEPVWYAARKGSSVPPGSRSLSEFEVSAFSNAIAGALKTIQTVAGEDVVYIHEGEEIPLRAVPGKTEFGSADTSGAVVISRAHDFTDINVSDLKIGNTPFLPAISDKIRRTIGTDVFLYEVLAMPNDEVWSYCDPDCTKVRVHTKEIEVD